MSLHLRMAKPNPSRQLKRGGSNGGGGGHKDISGFEVVGSPSTKVRQWKPGTEGVSIGMDRANNLPVVGPPRCHLVRRYYYRCRKVSRPCRRAVALVPLGQNKRDELGSRSSNGTAADPTPKADLRGPDTPQLVNVKFNQMAQGWLSTEMTTQTTN
ncbi:hypothetical protein LX36DRAFT_143204 [Colletotrichum falcatum]|nr:hypothetical protein LX36DRAFT_143204 [Colletotrichum falcatum]